MKLNRFCNFKFVECRYMMVQSEPIHIKRTWSERLFSRPWQPLRRTNVYVQTIPDPNFIYSKDTATIFGHPETIKTLKETINRYNEKNNF